MVPPVIYGKVGRLGHGKTMRMVVDGLELAALRGAASGRCWVASNIRIVAPEGWRSEQLPMDGFSEALAELMAEARAKEAGLVVLVDELDTVWDAHAWQDMRKSDRYRIKQSRKYGADLIWSAQFVDQVEKSIRNITEEVELLRAYPSPSIKRRESGKRPWVLRGQRFRPGAVRELTAAQDPDKRLSSPWDGWHRYRREHERLYDTDELVVPADLENLCGKHAREERERRCPRCARPSVVALAELVTAAAGSELPSEAA